MRPLPGPGQGLGNFPLPMLSDDQRSSRPHARPRQPSADPHTAKLTNPGMRPASTPTKINPAGEKAAAIKLAGGRDLPGGGAAVPYHLRPGAPPKRSAYLSRQFGVGDSEALVASLGEELQHTSPLGALHLPLTTHIHP
jgi:hypothetical protein